MDQRITEQLHAIRSELAPNGDDPALVRALASGAAPLGVLAELAAQQQRIITSDRRSLLLLATRCADRPLGTWFATLADGESAALRTLPALAAACGPGPDEAAARPPLPGCQAYPAYLAWLALNGRPPAVVLALVANFTAWGGYCAVVAEGLRRHYGFSDEACAFFDFFARPADALELQAADALAPESPGDGDVATAREYGTLLQAYEQLFWETLAARPVTDPVTHRDH
ncbi:transcriptional regulator [Kitasatospora sp. CM 4170]|uniref:Transcriptional regulator n=1 Tax=Kitasatospora aburaviensis TaxID=67265 RepID=A0ABW1EXZ0_9ACTN|nr:transcriptional regulator [Kitasatospora sp. CM 4170]WNM49666.1 transcriptional regulator [Kitasatospora sp. CM 4170]